MKYLVFQTEDGIAWNIDKCCGSAIDKLHATGGPVFIPRRKRDTHYKHGMTFDATNDEVWVHILDEQANEDYLTPTEFANLEDALPAELQPQEAL